MKYAGAALFFLSGCAALVYETVWIRLLSRLVGSDAAGMALVLSTFMGSLSLGAALFRPIVEKSKSPVRLFVLLELFVGLWAASSGRWIQWISPAPSIIERALFAVLVLCPPALGMGATFPLMGRLTIVRPHETALRAASFYGVNTLGAAAGAAIGPVLIMPWAGLSNTLIVAALLDAVVALLAPWVFRQAPVLVRGAPAGRRPWGRAMAVAGISGFLGLALEVVLARYLVSLAGASVYAYAMVLFVFLLGIGQGSLLFSFLTKRFPRVSTSRFLGGAAAVFVPAMLLGVLFVSLIKKDAGFSGTPGNLVNHVSLLRYWFVRVALCLVSLLPPATLLGLLMPSAIAAAKEEHPAASPERIVSSVYAANTLGALLGALAGAFLLLPNAGLLGSLFLLAGLSVVPAWLVSPGMRFLSACGGTALLFAGCLAWLAGRPHRGELLFSQNDAHSAVAVEHHRPAPGKDGIHPEVTTLLVNGKIVATTQVGDRRVQTLLGYLPLLLHGEVRSALVVGLGTGMTAGSLLDGPQLRTLEVFEISDAVPRAAAEFSAYNRDLLSDPRVKIQRVDGRHQLSISRKRWDLITSDPVHPWTRGSSDLFSVAHFSNMAEHLTPSGIASQWLPLYQLTERDVQTVISSWLVAFPRASAWLTGHDLILIGSRDALPEWVDPQRTPLSPAQRKVFLRLGIECPRALNLLKVAGRRELEEYVGEVPPMLDDHPVLEYRAPLSLSLRYSTEALLWAARPEGADQLPRDLQESGGAYRAIVRQFARDSDDQDSITILGKALARQARDSCAP